MFIPFLFLALIIFILSNQFYFPLSLLIILFSILSIFITRPNLSRKLKILSLMFMATLLGFYLFSQPLIIKHKGYGTDREFNLYNATVLWDFTSHKLNHIPKETFKDSNGVKIHLEDFAGKTLYVTFWATWCGPCLSEKPSLEKLKKKLQDNSDVVFVDISIDSDIEKWKSYLSKNNPQGIQLISLNKSKTYSNYKFSGIPRHIVIDSKGHFKQCSMPILLDDKLLTDSIKLNEYINKTSYKVFKDVKVNGRDTLIRVR